MGEELDSIIPRSHVGHNIYKTRTWITHTNTKSVFIVSYNFGRTWSQCSNVSWTVSLILSHVSTPRMHVCTQQSNMMQMGNTHIACLRCIILTAAVCGNIPLTAPRFERTSQKHLNAGINGAIQAVRGRTPPPCGDAHVSQCTTTSDRKAWGCSTCPWLSAVSTDWPSTPATFKEDCGDGISPKCSESAAGMSQCPHPSLIQPLAAAKCQ